MSWEDRAKEFLKEIVKIYSPTGHEKEVSLYIASFLEDLGFKNVEVDEIWNVSADVTEGSPTVYLIGHIDTVPGRLPVKFDGKKLYGRGVVDAKASFATFVMAAYLLKEEGFKGGLKVVGVVDEEGSGKGIRKFGELFPKPDYAVFGEPSGPNHITIGYKGRVQLSVRVETPTYHASAPWVAPNALQEALKAYEAIKRVAQSFDRSKRPGFECVSVCATMLRAGSSVNVTPGEAELVVDIRIPYYVRARKMAEDVRNGVLGAGLGVTKLKVNIEEITEAYEIKSGSPLVKAFQRGVYRVLRRPAKLVRKTGTGDMNYYGGCLGVPSLTVGPGNPALSHTPHEVMDMEEFINYIKIVKEALKELLEMMK